MFSSSVDHLNRYDCARPLGVIPRIPSDFHQPTMEHHMADQDSIYGVCKLKKTKQFYLILEGDLCIHVLDDKHLLEPLAHS